MSITRVETVHLSLPSHRQRVSLTDPQRPAATSLVAAIVHTREGTTGLGFTTTPLAGRQIESLIEHELGPMIVGESPLDHERLWSRAHQRFRPTGWSGLAARAYAAIDIALWDLKAKALHQPLFRLLGAARSSANCFAADAAPLGTDVAHALQAIRPLLEQGILGLSVEVGGGEMQVDADRVQQIRDGIGEDAWLGIAVDGRYDLGTALAMAHFYEEDVGIDWIDYPIPVEDRAGYRRLAERMEVPLALGSSFDDRDDFLRTLERGEVRVLRPDPLRLGGITPLLRVVSLAEAYRIPVVPHRLPEIAVHLCCGLGNVAMVEWGNWLAAAFQQPVVPREGKLVPAPASGHGLELNPEAVRRYRVE